MRVTGFGRLALLGALLMSALPLQAARCETLDGAMARAYQNNPDLNAVRARLRATDENVTIAKSAIRPQISASGTYTNVEGRVRNGPGYDYDNSSLGITITQVIFDGFQTLNNIAAARSDVYSSREQMHAAEIQILLAAVQAYADVARDQQVVALRRKNLSFLKEQLKAADARLSVGDGTRTDVAQAQAQLAGAQALLAAAIAQLTQSEATYVQIVGAAPKGITQPKPAQRSLPPSLDGAIQIGIRQHPTVLAALHSVNAAGYQVKSAEGTLLPGVVLQGNAARNWTNQTSSNGFFSTPSPDTENVTVGAQIRIPIYQGGAEFGNIRKAKETLGAQQLAVDSARAAVIQQITAAYAQVEAARAAIGATQQQVSAANQALKGVIEERNVGQKTTLDVLNSQQVVLNAQENLVVYRRDAVVASYSALAATGRLTVADQGLPVAEYRPEVHYKAVEDAWFGLRSPSDR